MGGGGESRGWPKGTPPSVFLFLAFRSSAGCPPPGSIGVSFGGGGPPPVVAGQRGLIDEKKCSGQEYFLPTKMRIGYDFSI